MSALGLGSSGGATSSTDEDAGYRFVEKYATMTGSFVAKEQGKLAWNNDLVSVERRKWAKPAEILDRNINLQGVFAELGGKCCWATTSENVLRIWRAGQRRSVVGVVFVRRSRVRSIVSHSTPFPCVTAH